MGRTSCLPKQGELPGASGRTDGTFEDVGRFRPKSFRLRYHVYNTDCQAAAGGSLPYDTVVRYERGTRLHF